MRTVPGQRCVPKLWNDASTYGAVFHLMYDNNLDDNLGYFSVIKFTGIWRPLAL